MTVVGKKQIWLLKRPCNATSRELVHEGHVYHLTRKPISNSDSQLFYTYFFCEGFVEKAKEKMTVGDILAYPSPMVR